MENPWNKRRFLAGKIIYKCTIFHGYVSHNQRVTAKKKNRRSPGWKVPRSSCETLRAPPRAVPLWHSAWDLSTSPATTCWGQTIILDLVVLTILKKYESQWEGWHPIYGKIEGFQGNSTKIAFSWCTFCSNFTNWFMAPITV